MDLSRAYECPVTGRFYDPRRVRRDLIAMSGGDINAWIASLAEPVGECHEPKLLNVVRLALGLPAIDPETGAGFCEETVLAALDAFTEYLAGKPETAQTSPTSAPCTGC